MAHLEAIAQVLEMYPKHHIYFLARDSELLYDFAKLSLAQEPAQLERIHLLNISRGNMKAAHVADYLAQEGISEATLTSGRKVLFVDTGLAGTIPAMISSYFSKLARENLKTHLLSSNNSSHPSTRVFLGYLNPAIAEMTPSALHGAIVSYEHMPRYTDRSNGFVQTNGRWVPISPKQGQEDGSVNKQIATRYQQDLAEFWNQSETRAVFEDRRQLYRDIYSVAEDQERLTERLRRLISMSEVFKSDVSKAPFEYIMLDLDDTLLKEVSVHFKNHPNVQVLNYAPAPAVLEKYQARLLGVNDPQKVIHYEIEGTQIKSFVALRPDLAEMLLSLSPLMKEGRKPVGLVFKVS
ncbi:MAG: hypothetical protein RBT63_11780 [Bdellovibrionales bacterium]|jgi:hypothetical protein|nr:hypothetical protein [Bdellovibrionales bacterium]